MSLSFCSAFNGKASAIGGAALGVLVAGKINSGPKDPKPYTAGTVAPVAADASALKTTGGGSFDSQAGGGGGGDGGEPGDGA